MLTSTYNTYLHTWPTYHYSGNSSLRQPECSVNRLQPETVPFSEHAAQGSHAPSSWNGTIFWTRNKRMTLAFNVKWYHFLNMHQRVHTILQHKMVPFAEHAPMVSHCPSPTNCSIFWTCKQKDHTPLQQGMVPFSEHATHGSHSHSTWKSTIFWTCTKGFTPSFNMKWYHFLNMHQRVHTILQHEMLPFSEHAPKGSHSPSTWNGTICWTCTNVITLDFKMNWYHFLNMHQREHTPLQHEMVPFSEHAPKWSHSPST
jgi:hypothetical protein